MYLTPDEESRVGGRAADFESRTGAQVVAAVVGKCDAYPEVPWKAFALGAAAASLAIVAADGLQSGWQTGHAALFHALAVLGAGAACALLAVFAPPFARLFLERHRRQTEVRQYAQAMFLARGLYETRTRSGILLLVSRFEREVVILPDIAVRRRVSGDELAAVIALMALPLRAGRTADALHGGLDALEALLASKGFAGPAAHDEIAEELVQEKGA